MTTKTEYGWIVENGTSSMKMVATQDGILVGDWVGKMWSDSLKTFRDAVRGFRDERLIVTLDGPRPRLQKLYERTGFRTAVMVKNWEA